MAPYRETLSCRACATRVTLAVQRTTDHTARDHRTAVAIPCPICDKALTLNVPLGIDGAAVELVGFECKQRP